MTSATSWRRSLFSLHSESNITQCNMRKLFKKKEKKHLNIHIFDWDIDVYVPENEEQRYIKAAENVSKKIEAYMDLYVRQQYVPQKSYPKFKLEVQFSGRGEAKTNT